jgi:hypothetical protein
MRIEEQNMADTAYSTEGETPLETAARAEAAADTGAAQTRREEQEADRLVADIDAYVARTDPSSLPEAERQLDAWEIPTDPLDGVPGDVALDPEAPSEALVSVFSAHSETEAGIVRGLLEASGIPVVSDGRSGPAMGGIFHLDETRWGDLLVPASLADMARAAIQDATEASA